MLDVAKVTSQDFVVDLGSGDGRNVIAAAKRGARALGVEYNPDMVELSKRNAAKAGVGDKATFVQGDMYAADFSAGHRAGAVPAARQPAEAAGQVRGPQARNAHRGQHLRHRGVDRRRDDHHLGRLPELVHGPALFRPGQSRRDLADGPGPADAQAAVSTHQRHARHGHYRERPRPRRRGQLHGSAARRLPRRSRAIR